MNYVRLGGEGIGLKKYGAATVGPKTTVKIEVEVTDTYELGILLQQLGEIDANQKRDRS